MQVTDICSTNTNDPTSCATPADIKIDRGKAGAMEGLPQPPTGDSYPEQIWWFFMKCWDDVSKPYLSATVHPTLTTVIDRVSPNQPTKETTGSRTLLCQTISLGPKVARRNKLKTIKWPMQPTAGQPIPTALTTPKGTIRPRHPSQIGLLETQLQHGVRLLEAKAGANLIHSRVEARLRLKVLLLHQYRCQLHQPWRMVLFLPRRLPRVVLLRQYRCQLHQPWQMVLFLPRRSPQMEQLHWC